MFIWGSAWGCPEQSELPPRGALFSCHAEDILISLPHHLSALLASWQHLQSQERHGWKGQSRLAGEDWYHDELSGTSFSLGLLGFTAGSSGPTLMGSCTKTISSSHELAWLPTFFNKKRTKLLLAIESWLGRSRWEHRLFTQFCIVGFAMELSGRAAVII